MKDKPDYSLLNGNQHHKKSSEKGDIPRELSGFIDFLVEIAVIRGGAAGIREKQQKRKKKT